MITKEELLKNGFVDNGFWAGRYYYSKNKFEIVDHCGIYRSDSKHWSGFGKEIETIEELNDIFKKWAKKQYENKLNKINTLHKEIEELEKLF